MDDVITLVGMIYKDDGLKQKVPVDSLREVWARIESISRSEWNAAGREGLNPQLLIVTAAVNYNGEKIVQIGKGQAARRYSVYRTYRLADSDEIELYLERKAGV